MKYQLAFPKRITLDLTKEGTDVANEIIKKHSGITHIYRTIYNFDGFPRTDTAIIDKLFFDFDHDNEDPDLALNGMRKLHEYLKSKKLKHAMFFSGNGFHLFLFTEKRHAREFHSPGAVTRNAHNYICKEADVEPDPKTKDVLRVARIPGTVNIKTGLYCIPLSPEDIYLSRDEILFFAKNPVSKKAISEGELFSLDGFDGYLDDEDISFIDSIDSFKDGDVLFSELPKCMAYSLACGDSGFQERFGIITALRDLCYSKGDAKEILKKYLTPKKYKHCVYEERQLDYLYERHDLLFPSCATLKAQGFCVSGCKGQNIYL